MTDNVFMYRTFDIDPDQRTVRFNYTIQHEGKKHNLTEVMKFPLELKPENGMESALRALHIALGISYYKIFLSPEIEHPYYMDRREADFWNDVFVNGLGEYLYVNKLQAQRVARFLPQEGRHFANGDSWFPKQRAMLGIGGGKDSIVAGELLKTLGVELDGFVMATGEQLGQTQSVTDAMDIGLSPVQRTLDKQLLELQELPGAYKGHIPISLIFGLVGAVLAIAQDAAYVVVANESSASIPRVTWGGKDVNHQWSKSFGFEQSFQAFLRENVSQHLLYFSAIRPLTSVAVARLFRRYPQYFEVFTSDNSVFRIDPSKRPNGRWSLESPKSLSSYILLGAWLSQDELLATFGKDFLDEPELEKLFYELTGIEGHQPLDCVGTVEELVLSLNLMARQGKCPDSFLMHKARERGLIADTDWDAELTKMIQPVNEQAFPKKLKQHLMSLITPKDWDLAEFAGKDIVFVGAGKGRAMAGVQQFLNHNVAINSFTGVNKTDDPDPLHFLGEYDQNTTIFIKNEGIPGSEMPVPYITQLQLFFKLSQKLNCKIIGITGTKGKSTTSALTAHILQLGGKDVILAGNIGVSPLIGLGFATKDTIFVLELSSYQLSDLTVSPHISACINLYNDHTDWHGSLEGYWEAKHNIMRFAGPQDVFIYNPGFPKLREWAETAACIGKPIDVTDTFSIEGAKLYGEHNRLNALVARQIAKEFYVDEAVIHRAIITFEPIEHRMEFVGVKNSRTFINDAIGMTPESTIATLKAVSGKFGQIGCLFLGGQDRNYKFRELMDVVAKLNIQHLVMFPETVEKMKADMPTGYDPHIYETEDMVDAVHYADTNAPAHSVVLLSTAAPSYLLWKDFEDKGTQFKQAVAKLK